MLLPLSQKRKKQVKPDKTKQITLPEIIKSEVNLLIFPFFALWKKDVYKKTKAEYKAVVKKGDQELRISWKVSANPEYGYPGSFDKKVYKAVEQIISRLKLPIQNPICIGSLYHLCKIMGIKKDGREYKAIKKALIRLKTTSIHSKGAFYSKEKREWVEDIFSLYDRVIFKGEKFPNGEIADTNYIFLNSWYLDNINARYVKPIDWKYYRSLKSPIASRLYELLSVKFYGLNGKQECIRYRYSTLCSLLPVARQRYKSLAKRQLNPAHRKLKQTGFLEEYLWRPVAPARTDQKENDWYLFYYPGEKAKEEMRRRKEGFFEVPAEEEALSEPLTKSQTDLVNQLIAFNISKEVAEDLVKHNNQQIIKKWVKAIPYTKAEDKAAYLVKAIKEEWQLPEKYLKTEKKRKRKEKLEKVRLDEEKRKKREQEKRKKEVEKLDRIYSSLTPSQQKEVEKRAKKRLSSFIKDRLEKNLKKGEVAEPIKAALKSKRREVVKDWLTSGKIKDSNGENENEA